MGVFSKLFSPKGKATALYKSGMKKAKERDLKGAIEDYTAVMEMEGAPADVKIMARFNRALAHSTNRDYEKARADLNAVVAAPQSPAEVKTKANEKLAKLLRRVGGAAEEAS